MKNRVIALLLAGILVCAGVSVQATIRPVFCEVENGVDGEMVTAVLEAAAAVSDWTYQELSGWYAAGEVEIVREEEVYLVRVNGGGGASVIIFIDDIY